MMAEVQHASAGTAARVPRPRGALEARCSSLPPPRRSSTTAVHSAAQRRQPVLRVPTVVVRQVVQAGAVLQPEHLQALRRPLCGARGIRRPRRR